MLVIACCATLAVNLEMSLSMGADHVIAVLQRHVGVFGGADYINSNGGPDLVKPRKIVQERASLLAQEGWVNVGCPKWRINVPYSPTWSSHVEAMVKITKIALRKLHTRPTTTKLTPDEFYTQLKRCQGYINMRPLVDTKWNKPILSPADFIGTGCKWLTSFVYEPEEKGSIGYRYKQVEKLRQEVWKAFRVEYVTWLRRQSSGMMNPLPEKDDLVLRMWQLGREMDGQWLG